MTTGFPPDTPLSTSIETTDETAGQQSTPDLEESFASASRSWWDSDADRYHSEHPAYLSSFFWCPEMLHEADARLLGDVSAASVLEIGCGSAPCATWLNDDGVGFVTGIDISMQMLRRSTGAVPLAQADAMALPFKDASFDVVYSAFGAIPFVASSISLNREVARVLKPGGLFVYSINHPMRWIFPDSPSEDGLTVVQSYFDRTPYVEVEDGEIVYAEQHRTIGDRFRELRETGFEVLEIIEPEWPDDLEETWGQWSPLRGRLFPGTVIFKARKAVDAPAS